MKKTILSLVLLATFACGKEATKETGIPDRTIPPVVVDPADMNTIVPLLPSMYYLPQEKNITCVGKYSTSGPVYDGSERSNIRDRKGKIIATVCTRFYRVLNMEGSAILKDRGDGEIAVNYAGVVSSDRRFRILAHCSFGEGVKKNLCLLPHHTLATDNKAHAVGDIIYMPKADGLVLPDGTLHEGFFIVRDTGGAFQGIGAKRVDIFTGVEPDLNNTFSRAGFNHHTETEAFKVTGKSADLIRNRLKEKFGQLY